MLTSIIITITCFLTATLQVYLPSGGILLRAFCAFFSIPVAMVLHGIIQAFSNGSLAIFWVLTSNGLLPVYALGVLTALILCSFFI